MKIAFLRKLQRSVVAFALGFHFDVGRAGLHYEGRHDLVDGLVRSARHRAPEIGCGSVAVRVLLQVEVHAGAEGLRPQI